MQKRRIVIGGILCLALIGGGAALWWPSREAPASQQITETTVATRNEDVSPINKIPQTGTEQPKEKPQVKQPIKDVFAYSFESEKVFIVAGSVTANKEKHEWQAKIKSINKKGEPQSVQQVFFKQEGKQILTSNGNGKWRPIDEMDKSLFNKVVDISGTF